MAETVSVKIEILGVSMTRVEMQITSNKLVICEKIPS